MRPGMGRRTRERSSVFVLRSMVRAEQRVSSALRSFLQVASVRVLAVEVERRGNWNQGLRGSDGFGGWILQVRGVAGIVSMLCETQDQK